MTMGKKKLSDIKAELAAHFAKLRPTPPAWFDRQIELAQADPNRDVRVLKALRAVFEPGMPKSPKRTKE
jgi:hypothetical protein